MLTILSCDCGHRFEVKNPQGSQVPCPACGHLLDLPSEPPVTLRMSKLLQQSTVGERDALPACSLCRGTGQCQVCSGRGTSSSSEGFFRVALHVLLFVFVGFWLSYFFRSAIDQAPGTGTRLGYGGCLQCNGRGKCFRCRGSGLEPT